MLLATSLAKRECFIFVHIIVSELLRQAATRTYQRIRIKTFLFIYSLGSYFLSVRGVIELSEKSEA